MKIKSALSLFTALAFISGCSTMKVTSESDPNYTFVKIKTFQWIDGPTEVLNKANIYINEDIQKALNSELIQQGLQSVSDPEQANVQVAYYLKLKEEVEYTDSVQHDERDFSGGFVYRRESSSWNYEEREPDLNVYTIEMGTLTVLIYDAGTGSRIWKGILKTKIDRSQSKEQQHARIEEASKKLMDPFLKKLR